jgi:flavodoxin
MKKAMVIYDSQYGNTRQVAEAIGRVLGTGFQVEVLHVNEMNIAQLKGLDLLIVGSPTQRFRPTAATSNFLKQIAANGLQGVQVAAFDTRLTREEIEATAPLAFFVRIFGYAAQPVASGLQKKGGEQVLTPEGFFVEGMEGPLVDGELERAEEWAYRLISEG